MAAGGMTEAEQKEFVSSRMDSDLQFVLADSGVSLQTQVAVARFYGSLKKFNAIGDNRPAVRTLCLQDFGIPQDTPEGRAETASVVSAWEAAQEYINKETELRAEAKVMGQPRMLQTHERQAMVRAIEQTYGVLGEAETPSSDFLSVKAEETESNEPCATPLDEILSKRDASTSVIQSAVDSSGHIKVTRTKSKGKMPTNTEEYRRLIKVEGYAWMCMAARYKAKSWLHDLTLDHFTKFADFILGDRVLNIQVPNASGESSKLKPDWTIVLSFEFKLRKEAFRLVLSDGYTLGDALKAVMRDAELKEAYFTTPIALKAASSVEPPPQNKFPRFNSKGYSNQSKGFSKNQQKGKGRGKSKGKSMDERLIGLTLAWRTPDGRDLCFGYNNGSCNGDCGRVHKCRVKGCYKDHPAIKHRELASGGA